MSTSSVFVNVAGGKLRIKEYISPKSGEVAMLVNDAGMPLHFANRYAYSMLEKPGKSISSIQKALYVISRLYLWADLRAVDLDQILYYGDFLASDQISDIVDFIHFTSSTQNDLLKVKQNQTKTNNSGRSNVISFKNSAKISYKYTSNEVYANRLRILRKFLKWVPVERKAQRIYTPSLVMKRSTLAINIIETNIPRVRSRQDDEKLEAVDLDIIERIAKVLHPDHPHNPFSTSFIRHRNYLLLLLLIESGGRRREVYQKKSKDIIISTLQYDIRHSKTNPRTLPISRLLVDAFETYHQKYWRHLDGKGKRSGYIFVKSNGERLKIRTLNYVVEKVREKIPEVPAWFHTHTIRRTFNHRLSLLIDQKRAEGHEISHEEERKIRNRLSGWRRNSRMGEIYNARHLREKADRLAELALNTIGDSSA